MEAIMQNHPEGIAIICANNDDMAMAAARAAAAREYAAKRGISIEEAEKVTCMSGIPERPFCKGRNYDPNRYKSEE